MLVQGIHVKAVGSNIVTGRRDGNNGKYCYGDGIKQRQLHGQPGSDKYDSQQELSPDHPVAFCRYNVNVRAPQGLQRPREIKDARPECE